MSSRKRSRAFTTAVVAAVAMAMAGCSSTGGSPGETGSAPASGAPEAEGTPPHMLSFSFDHAEGVFDDFTKQTGIKVVYENSPSADFPSVLQTRVAAKADIDLINLRGGAEFNQYASAGTFVDLSGQPFLKNVNPGAVKNAEYDGTTYGFSLSSYVIGVFYNKDLFAKLSIDVPQNWPDFIAAAEKVRDSGTGVAPFVASAADGWTNQYIYHNAIAEYAAEHPDFTKNLKTGDAKWTDNDLFTTQIQRFGEMVDDGLFIEGGQSLRYADAQAAFAAGRAAMWIHGSWGLSGLEPQGFTPGAFPLPINDPGAPVSVASSLSDNIVGITSWSSKKDAALQLLEYMTTAEFGSAYQGKQGVKSSANGVTGPAYSEYEGDWDALFPDAVPFPLDLGPTVNNDGPNLLGEILAGTSTPDQVIEKFQQLQDNDNNAGY